MRVEDGERHGAVFGDNGDGGGDEDVGVMLLAVAHVVLCPTSPCQGQGSDIPECQKSLKGFRFFCAFDAPRGRQK